MFTAYVAIDRTLRFLDAFGVGGSVYERYPGSYERRLVQANDAYIRMTGRDEAELLAVDARTLQHSTNSRARSRYLQEQVEQGSAYDGEFAWKLPDGGLRWMRYSAFPQHLDGRIYVVGMDMAVEDLLQGLGDELPRLADLPVGLTRG